MDALCAYWLTWHSSDVALLSSSCMVHQSTLHALLGCNMRMAANGSQRISLYPNFVDFVWCNMWIAQWIQRRMLEAQIKSLYQSLLCAKYTYTHTHKHTRTCTNTSIETPEIGDLKELINEKRTSFFLPSSFLAPCSWCFLWKGRLIVHLWMPHDTVTSSTLKLSDTDTRFLAQKGCTKVYNGVQRCTMFNVFKYPIIGLATNFTSRKCLIP